MDNIGNFANRTRIDERISVDITTNKFLASVKRGLTAMAFLQTSLNIHIESKNGDELRLEEVRAVLYC